MRRSCNQLTDYIGSTCRSAAEIGVGHFPDVGFALLEKGLKVFATDIRPFSYDGFEVFVDDITEPNLLLYKGVDIIYSVRPPLELVPYIRRVAGYVSARVVIKSLSSEYPGGRLKGNGNETFFLWSDL